MILLDTNIVSEMMKAAPAEAVAAWLNAQDAATLFVSVVTIGEVTYGLRVLPDGRRRQHLEAAFERVLAEGFEGRVLGFDETAARLYGDMMAHRRRIGRSMSLPDGIIAAIARTRGMAVATRNITDFDDCGIEVIDPFDAIR